MAATIRAPQSRRNSGYFLPVLLCALLLSACSSVPLSPLADNSASSQPAARTASSGKPVLPAAGSGRGGYYQDDGPGDQTPEGLLDTPDPEPKIEPYARTGNKAYVVFGKTYQPVLDERPYKQRGRGSWYGKKFHGQRTSSGERYDMYQMTAAHPTLPIPSYARVTNLANGRQVIVRVNDRGPFLSNRIIDLSYTAALKLGYLQQGSAELEVERLLPDEIRRMTQNRQAPVPAAQAETQVQPAVAVAFSVPVASQSSVPVEPTPTKPANNAFAEPVVSAVAETGALSAKLASGFYLQLGAYSKENGAQAARNRLQQQWLAELPPVGVQANGAVFRVISGPFGSRAEAAAAAQKIQAAGAVKPVIVQR